MKNLWGALYGLTVNRNTVAGRDENRQHDVAKKGDITRRVRAWLQGGHLWDDHSLWKAGGDVKA